MRLATLEEFRSLVWTPASAPSIKTLRKRIHQIPGGRIELGRYYVDLDEYDRRTNLRSQVQAELDAIKQEPLLEGLF